MKQQTVSMKADLGLVCRKSGKDFRSAIRCQITVSGFCVVKDKMKEGWTLMKRKGPF
jgi:hypothetical protein